MSNQIKATLVILIFIYGLQVNAQVGNSAPDFIVTDVHGKTHRLYDYIEQGKKVIIDFSLQTAFLANIIHHKLIRLMRNMVAIRRILYLLPLIIMIQMQKF